MAYTKKSGPEEERDFDPVVPCRKKFKDIEEFGDTAPNPEEIMALRERLFDSTTSEEEAEAILEILDLVPEPADA